ncbi:DUF3027 domain-containing protein [Cryobacterium roopkundense]|uniref:DUF3027 domain-containing protein n=1 Tax=Cryobacterium roopkundense TaxID=1001240 RepID=A0A7W8ZT60_9MICO|nr:DUF3027 domain-containing protein [Cryobacterium roopkundense]MBB5639736.1 hypothetical protein [Cryobacterium roopkundense]
MPDPEDSMLHADASAQVVPADILPAEVVPVVDEVLLAAVDVARAALEEITPADSIGRLLGHIVEGERVVSLLFDCTLPGYPGWQWTVTLARTDENAEPTVLETELMPGEYALTAPDWVPWSDRLMDGEGDDESDDDSDDESDDDDESDPDDESEDGSDDESDDDDDEDDDEPDDGFDADRADDHLDGIDFDEALAAPHLHPDKSE